MADAFGCGIVLWVALRGPRGIWLWDRLWVALRGPRGIRLGNDRSTDAVIVR